MSINNKYQKICENNNNNNIAILQAKTRIRFIKAFRKKNDFITDVYCCMDINFWGRLAKILKGA